MHIPDIMYFGAQRHMTELKGRVFLTPHIGIASLFIIDTADLFPKGYATRCNISYRQWDYPNDRLQKPLKSANLIHNIAEFGGEVFSGSSSGYIYSVDVSKVKDRLSLFTTNDPDRELIYNGEEPLTVIEFIPHSLQWDFAFDMDEVRKHGAGTAEKIEAIT